jgi:hypothetical protein
VVGHGRGGSAPRRSTDVDTAERNTGEETVNHRTAIKATSTTTTAATMRLPKRATFSRSMDASTLTGMRSPKVRSRSSLGVERQRR